MAKTRKAVNAISECGSNEGMRACSACAGDYEDPDRTAWTPDEMDHDPAGDERDGATEEFPAEEQ